ncbi:MAG: GNAT family N-acetyltransferase [Candidatus Nanoarchaeia archaeon]|nr:GNAT family N-acetyltransferase [Candidatus Nanoarchaeia archaeon]
MKVKLEGNKIKIRKIGSSDVGDIYQNVKDKEVTKWTLNIPHPYSRKDAIAFVKRCRNKLRKEERYTFGIILKETNKLVGLVSLFHVHKNNKNAELGYWLGKNYWGKGIMSEAVKLIIKFGFEELKLHRIYAEAFEENIASRKVLEKAGFKLEGIRIESRYKYKKFHNNYEFGILKKYKPPSRKPKTL